MPNNNPAGAAGFWPEEHAQELIRLCGEKLSFRAIATVLNEKFGTSYTKNSMIGKAARLGISKESAPTVPGNHKPKADRKTPYKVRAPRKQTEGVKREVFRAKPNSNGGAPGLVRVMLAEISLRCVEIEPRHLSLIELEPNDCRYPYGDDQITFCGHPKMAGSSYCVSHHHLCTEAPRIPIHRFAGVAA
jgi:GcrA cell cycle regulator